MNEQKELHLHYDPLLEGIRFESELNRYLLYEESGNGYIKWKVNALAFMQSNMAKFKMYLQTQANTYNPLLSKYREVIQNNQLYPSKRSMKNTVDYKQTIARLNRPITNGLQGLNLDRIDISKEGKKNNLWLYKQFVPIYDGSKTFVSIAKKYFSGEDTKITLSKEGVNELLDLAWSYCINTQSILKALESEARSIFNYVNNNPINGQQEIETQATVNQQQQQQNNNNVNASYEAFARYYFNEVDNTPSAPNTTNTIQSQVSNTVRAINNKTSMKSNNPKDLLDKKNNNKAKDNTAETYKRKIIVCKILIQCFNAKMTGYGIVYKELMDIMKSHIVRNRKDNK